MAVYKRTYHGYSGPVTADWSRFAIIPRYAYRDLFRSKMVTAFFVGAFLPPIVFLLLIYLSHSLPHLAQLMGQRGTDSPITVNSTFFLVFLNFQSALAFIFTAFVGPGLVSRDLANRALPLYLSRPFSRAEYVAGKMSVLLILLSLITWIPGLILFGVQATLAGGEWLLQNFWLAWALVAGAWIWILILSLMALALSAWVKWRIAAGALLLAVFFVTAGFTDAINKILDVRWGKLFNPMYLLLTIWRELFRVKEGSDISVASAWIMLALICAACLWLLYRKLRAIEVVR
jgi:ABC-2 type transport system permease protein